MFTPNCRRCTLPLKLTGFVLNVSKSCTLCPMSLTQFIFWLNRIMCMSHEGKSVFSTTISNFPPK
ncbi:hypothetical protein Hanom_Chr03g00193901 [Helianthus anomalus]